MVSARKPPAKKRVTASLMGKPLTRKISQVFFRSPAELIKRVERVAKARAIPVTRQTWLLEAITEKLERETTGS